MMHKVEASQSNSEISVSDAQTANPLVNISMRSGSSFASTFYDAKKLDDLITVLQFYRSRLDFTPPETK